MHDDQIRQAELDDSTALVCLFDALNYPTDAATIRQRLSRIHSDATYEAWVADQDGAVLGFAAGHLVFPLEEDHPAAQLIALVTAPHHERSGVGHALCEHVEAWALTNGARRLIVNSGDHRVESHAFYLRSGYTRTGVRFGKLLAND